MLCLRRRICKTINTDHTRSLRKHRRLSQGLALVGEKWALQRDRHALEQAQDLVRYRSILHRRISHIGLRSDLLVNCRHHLLVSHNQRQMEEIQV